jgi:hypothetical protein
MKKEKLIHQLFVGKINEILGWEYTLKLLKESHKEVNEIINQLENNLTSIDNIDK